MVYEVVIQTIDPERRDEYVKLYKERWRGLAFDGWQGGRILKGLEDPRRVVLVLEWDSVEAHRQHRGTSKMVTFLEETVRPYQTAVSDFDHFIVEDLGVGGV